MMNIIIQSFPLICIYSLKYPFEFVGDNHVETKLYINQRADYVV